MDAAWCYLCRVDNEGTDPHVLWGLAFDDDLEILETEPGPMRPEMAAARVSRMFVAAAIATCSRT